MIKLSRKVTACMLLQAALAPVWGYAQRLSNFALQYSVPVRNAKLDAVETTIGTLPIIEFRTGAPPADCATAASGTLLAQAALPSDWLAAAAAGSKAKAGTWQFSILAGISGQTIGYFRIYDSGSPSACHIQGTVTATGSGGDMTVDNTNVSAAQVVTVNTFTLNAGNA
jgi:hypothetical protein